VYENFLFEILIGRCSLMCKNQFIIEMTSYTYEHIKFIIYPERIFKKCSELLTFRRSIMAIWRNNKYYK